MYIRKVSKKDPKTGVIYYTYKLVEGYRNIEGKVCQEVLLNLGVGFSMPAHSWKSLCERVNSILSGQEVANDLFGLDIEIEAEAQKIAKQLLRERALQSLDATNQSKANKQSKQYDLADLDSVKHSDIKEVGSEYVGYSIAQQLGLPMVLEDCGLNFKQINLALCSIIGRLCAPASELSTYNYLQNDSSLDELLDTDFTNMTLRSLYVISDVLLKHKDKIESKLYSQEKNLFNLTEVITLFDITNTYFEGRNLANSKAKYGRSKEKRSDCKLVALGLLLDGSGFPKSSKIFPGNVSEPGTLKEMLATLGANPNITIIMDAGIATQENIKYLCENKYKYIVVSRSHNLTMPDVETVIAKQDSGNEVKVALVSSPDSDEVELYCHSEAKEAKAHELATKMTQRYEMELTKLAEGLEKVKTTKKYAKILQRLGRLAEKYKSVSGLYATEVIADKDQTIAISINWSKKKEAVTKKEAGIYCLKSNRKDLDAKTLWETYTMLTDLEAAFRSLKSELGFRPVYHQKEERVDGHLFISLLAYHLLHAIRYQLKAHGIHDSWDSLRKKLNRQHRVTTTINLEGGKTVHIRKTSQATGDVLKIYQALNINNQVLKTTKTYIQDVVTER